MLGRATGINGGRAGSMNINSPKDRLVGSFGIVGGTIAAATGVGLALKRVGGVAVCQFGDGAINQGYFYECLNFCAVLRLPVVFLCENNGYGEYTPFQDVTAGAIRGAGRGDGGARRDDRRDERGRRAGGRRPSGRPRPRRRRARPSSRRSPTATSGTPAATPARTGRPASSTRGRSATRSRGCAASSWTPGSIRRSSTQIDAEVADAARRRWSAGASRRRSRSRGPTRGVQRVSQDVLRMPRLSDSMSEATIVGWLKQPGESFLRGDAAGRGRDRQGDRGLRGRGGRACSAEILVPEGGVAALGEPIARLAAATTATTRRQCGARGSRQRCARAPIARPRRLLPRSRCAATRARATPVARRTASQLGVSLLGLDGTGPGGRIRKLDVRAGRIARRRPGGARRRSTSRARRRWSSCRRRPDDRAPHDAVAVGDPVVRRRRCRSTCPRSSQLRRGAGDLVGDGPVGQRLRRQGRRRWRCASTPRSTARSSTGEASATAG